MSPTPFVFGKVPERGDFARAGQAGPLVQEVDGWLQRALLAYRRPLPEGPALGVAWGRGGDALLAALQPSRDRAGRSYPLLAGAALSVPPGAPASGTVGRHTPLLRLATVCAAEVVAGERTPEDVLPALDAAGPDEDDFLDAAPAQAFGAIPLGEPLTRLAHVLGPVGRGGTPPRYGLGVPLPVDGAARPAAVAFWLEAATRLAGALPVWTLLWTGEGPYARLALFLGPPTADVLPYLFDGAAVEGVYDLDAVTPAFTGRAEGAPTLRALLNRL